MQVSDECACTAGDAASSERGDLQTPDIQKYPRQLPEYQPHCAGIQVSPKQSPGLELYTGVVGQSQMHSCQPHNTVETGV